MKRALILALLVIGGAAALYLVQRHGSDQPASANALLRLIGAVERESSHAPLRAIQLSDAEEIRIGNELAARYAPAKNIRSPHDQKMQAYVEAVGRRVAVHAHRRLPYRFHYISDPGLVNAFALPGGHVFIGAGLLGFMQTEDELAAVLGHELEHIDRRHCAERVVIEARLRHLRLDLAGALLSIPMAIFQAGYSKEQELEADREGTRLAVAAGYSPQGAIDMFEEFARLHSEYVVRDRTPQQELSRVAADTLRGYFRSHPLPQERIAEVEALIHREHWPARQQQPLQVAVN